MWLVKEVELKWAKLKPVSDFLVSRTNKGEEEEEEEIVLF